VDEFRIWTRVLSPSEIETLAELSSPIILSHPLSQVVQSGSSVELSVVAGGSPNLAYQWKKDGSPVADGGLYSGVNTATLTITNFDVFSVGEFTVEVSNAYGDVTSEVARLDLATKIWDGEAGDNQWSTASNWAPDGVPGAGDHILIDVEGDLEIILGGTGTTVNSLFCNERFRFSGPWMLFTGRGIFTKSFVTEGGGLTANGDGDTRVQLLGPSDFLSADIAASSGGQVELSNVGMFTSPNESSYSAADGVGAKVYIGGLSSLDPGNDIRVQAAGGAVIVLADLTQIKRAVQIGSDGAGSRVSMPCLVSTDGSTRHPEEIYLSLSAINQGAIDAPNLTTLTGTYVNAGSGSVLSFPNAQSFVGAGNGSGVSANGAGSRVDLSSLTSFAGTTGGRHLSVPTITTLSAEDGGELDMSGVTTINKQTHVRVLGAGSRMMLNSVADFDGTIRKASGDRLSTSVDGGELFLLASGSTRFLETYLVLANGGRVHGAEVRIVVPPFQFLAHAE